MKANLSNVSQSQLLNEVTFISLRSVKLSQNFEDFMKSVHLYCALGVVCNTVENGLKFEDR